MSDVRSLTRPREGRQAAVPALLTLTFVLALAGVTAPWSAAAQTVDSGLFRFSSTLYVVTENESFQAGGLQNPVFLPTKNPRSVQGAVLTVVREGGTSGRVHVPYSTVDLAGLTCGDTNSNAAVPFDPGLFCGDYIPTAGTLVFDEFETSKSFVIVVLSDFTVSGNKQLTVSLGPPTLDPAESPDLLPPDVSDPDTTLRIVEINFGNLAAPLVGPTNFVIERAFYSMDETEGTISVDILHPSGSGGEVGVEVLGSDRKIYGTSAGSDYAHYADVTYPNPTYTDGTTDFTTGTDFVLANAVITFGQGQFRRQFTIQVLDDDVTEFNEDMRVRLIRRGPMNPPLGFNSGANIKILYQEAPAGALDREWNADHVASTTPRFNPAPGANNPVRAVAVQADDKTLIGGDFTAYNATPRNRLTRINVDGSVDATFEPGTGADDFVSGIAVYPPGSVSDGKILIVGGFTSYNNIQRNGIARVNANGALDGTFAVGTGANGIVRSVGIQADEKVVIVGEFTEVNGITRNGVARLNPDGSVDAGFDPGAGADGPVWAVAVAAGRIYVAGDFLVFGGEFRGRVARVNDNGAVDLSFDPGGGADGPVYTLALQTDGRLLLGGAFTHFDFRTRSGIARLENSGNLDLDYDPGSGANDSVYAIALQPDGKAIVGGLFTQFNLTRRVGLTRLFVNGKVDTSFIDTAYNQFAGLINDLYYQVPNYVNAVGIQSDGNVMIGGQFSQVGGNKSGEIFSPAFPEYFPLFTFNDPFFGTYLGTTNFVWTRAEKRPRSNIARLLGGYTPGPGNVEFVYPQNTVDESSPTLTVALQRRDGQLGALLSATGTTNGIALGGSIDFEDTTADPQWGYAAFAAFGAPLELGAVGERYDFEIPIIEDGSIEGDEVFSLGMTDPLAGIYLGGELIWMGGALGRSSSSVTIVDNDFNRGEMVFSSPVYTTNENAGIARITVRRLNGSTGPVTVKYYTRDDTSLPPDEMAVAGRDYTATQGTLTFGSGVTAQTFNVTLRDNFVVDRMDRWFIVVLTNATAGAIIPPGGITASAESRVRLIDNDLPSGKAYFVDPDPVNNPGGFNFTTNEAAGVAQIALERLGGSIGELTVTVAATNGTGFLRAVAGVDFVGVTNTVTWVHGDVAPKIVQVPLIDNLNVVSDKFANLRMYNPSVIGGIGQATATLTILEDDQFGNISFSQPIYDADERGTNVWITVIREGGSGGTVTVDYQAIDGTAINGINNPTDYHYLLAAGTLTFGPGVVATNFVITIRDNQMVDGVNGISDATLELTGASGTYPQATLRIFDDESVGDPAGSLDPTFNSMAGASDSVNALALQPDGKILAAGSFRMMNRVSRTRIARLLSDGTLDDSFDARQGPNAPVRAMALQGDRVVIGGQFTQVAGTNRNYIARLLSDGTLDRFFNPGGGADAPVLALAALPDGGVVVGGGFASINGISRPGVAVLNSNGTVRASFNPGIGVAGSVLAVAVQPDGRILVGGEFTSVGGFTAPYIARLHRDGTLDSTFNTGLGPNGTVRAIQLQPDGSILIGGSFTQVDGSDRGRIARLRPSGALDTLFQSAVAGANSDVLGLALQFDGKIIVTGEFTSFNGVTRNRIARLNQNGKTDTSINFGEGADKAVAAAVIQDDRRIVIGGRFSTFDGQPRAFIARLHGGSIAGSGSFQFDSPLYQIEEFQQYATITVIRRGGLAGDVTVDYASIAGSATPDADYTNVVGTLTFPEGEVRAEFAVPLVNDSLGETPETVTLSLSNPSAGTLGVVPNATLLIISDDSGIGFAASSFAVSEGIAGGQALISVTRTGATNETTTVLFSTTPTGTALAGADYAPVSGTLVFVPGQTLRTFGVPIVDDDLIEPTETFGVVLSNATGSASLQLASASVSIIDNDFSPGDLALAETTLTVPENGGSVDVVVLRTNGVTGVVTVQFETMTGTASTNDFVARTGVLTFVEGQSSGTITITILDDNLVEGDESFTVRLFNPTGGATINGQPDAGITILDEEIAPGSLDRTFDPGIGPDNLVRTLGVMPDGRVLIGGSFSAVSGITRPFVARLTSSGAVDPLFDPGIGPNGLVTSLSLGADESATIGGGFTSLDGRLANRVGRLLTGGDVDVTFQANSGFNGSVHVVDERPDGRIVVGGAFGLPGRGVIQLRSDGTVDTAFNPGLGTDGPVHAVALLPDGRLVIGGAFNFVDGEVRSRIAVLRTDGTVDGTFVPTVITNGTVYALAVQQDGRVVAAGDFGTIGAGAVRIARFNTDGSRDGTFAVGTGANDIVFAMGLDSADRIILGGAFTSINGTNRSRFARLNANGGLDRTLDPGPGANGTVLAISVLPTDDFVIGGDFTMVNGSTRSRVARILGGNVAPGLRVATFSAAGGTFNLGLAVVPGRQYALESSPDLQNWTVIRTTTATSDLWQVTDPIDPGAAGRFYRLREVAP